jgi:phospholipase/carboxylesterase
LNNYSTSSSAKHGNWILRQYIPESEFPNPIYILLHGWTGDENAMWIFSSRLPTNAAILSPRAPFKASIGGYSWYKENNSIWPNMKDFEYSILNLLDLLKQKTIPQGAYSNVNLIGFSQGAALALAFVLKHSKRISSVACLSGFLPSGIINLIKNQPLLDLPIFITHGTQDNLVPVEKARYAVQKLKQAGGKVTYCEEDVGHKLSASCFRSMEIFLKQQSLYSN